MTSKDDTYLLVNQLFKEQRFEQALKLVDTFIAQHPKDSAVRALGAKNQLALRRPLQALENYRIAFDDGLDDEEALGIYTSVLYERGEYQQAVRVLHRLTVLFDQGAVYFSNLGYMQYLIGQRTEAVKNCSHAIQLDQNHIEAYCNLGTTLVSLGQFDQAIEVYRRGIAINPKFARLHTGIGVAHQRCAQFSKAIDAHQQAISLDSSCIEAYCNLGLAQLQSLQAGQAVRSFQQALQINPHYQTAASNLQLALQYLPNAPLSLLQTPVNYPAVATLNEKGKCGKHNSETAASKLRVGFVSADFCKHPVGYFLRGLFDIPRSNGYEFYCYANQTKSDSTTQALRGNADSWRDVLALSDRELAETVVADEIDILVDLSGHTEGNRLGVFALRPARVQVSWLGYFASTNTSFMDYALLGAEQAPPDTEKYYSEKLARLDCCQFVYSPPENEIDRHEPGRFFNNSRKGIDESVVFGCFNNAAKINEELISIWSQILKAIPRSLLVLKWKSFEDSSVCEETIARFRRYGIPNQQLQLRGSSSHEKMLAQYNDIDIALDTAPFSGALTSCEALWMGVPVVSMRGPRPVSRQTHTILESIGLQCLSSESSAAYVETAIRLATDEAFFNEVSQGLRERLLKSSSDNLLRLSAELESFFNRAVQ